MKMFLSKGIYIIMCNFLFVVIGNSQVISDSIAFASHSLSREKGLFEKEEVFDITLSGNMWELLNDRSKMSRYHPMLLSYKKQDGSSISLETEIKTRGHFRKLKENCIYPPLLIHFFKTESIQSSIFKEQDKLKLVMPCQGDEYVIHEWLVYKLYNLVTPKSFKENLV